MSTAVSDGPAVVVNRVYASRAKDFDGQVTVDSVSGGRVFYSGDADGQATVEEFLSAYVLLTVDSMTREQLTERANALESEIEANEEETRAMQTELDGVYARIDALAK
jgi:hypothetical protein